MSHVFSVKAAAPPEVGPANKGTSKAERTDMLGGSRQSLAGISA